MVKEYSGIEKRYEGTSTIRAILRAALVRIVFEIVNNQSQLWVLPYIPAFLWLSIPLNRYDENSSRQNFYIFAWVYHVIYVVITAYCGNYEFVVFLTQIGFLLVGFTIPVPKFKIQMLVLLLVALITGCFDMIIYYFEVSFIQVKVRKTKRQYCSCTYSRLFLDVFLFLAFS